MNEHIYGNTLMKQTQESGFNQKGFRLVVPVCVLLVLSVMANALLIYKYHNNAKDPRSSCEPATNCSTPGDDPTEQAMRSFSEHLLNHNRSTNHHCPGKNVTEKWIRGKSSFYVFSNDLRDWTGSRRRCQGLGGDLVIIHSQEEQDFLARHIRSFGAGSLYWFGLTDAHKENDWRWVDHSALVFKHWNSWSPDNYQAGTSDEDCAVLNGLSSSAEWGDVSCFRKERSICEILCA